MFGCLLVTIGTTYQAGSRPRNPARLYRPGVIVGYAAILGLPFGLALYGINTRRCGDRLAGAFLILVSAGAQLLVLITRGLAPNVVGLPSIGVFALLPLYQLANWPFESAVRRGAQPARWWPPLLMFLALIIVLAAVTAYRLD